MINDLMWKMFEKLKIKGSMEYRDSAWFLFCLLFGAALILPTVMHVMFWSGKTPVYLSWTLLSLYLVGAIMVLFNFLALCLRPYVLTRCFPYKLVQLRYGCVVDASMEANGRSSIRYDYNDMPDREFVRGFLTKRSLRNYIDDSSRGYSGIKNEENNGRTIIVAYYAD